MVEYTLLTRPSHDAVHGCYEDPYGRNVIRARHQEVTDVDLESEFFGDFSFGAFVWWLAGVGDAAEDGPARPVAEV